LSDLFLIVTKLSEIWDRSGISNPEKIIPDLGVKKAPDTGSGSATLARRREHSKDDCNTESSVADPGCLSRIPDPGFFPSRIPDLGSRISDPGSRIPDPKKHGEVKIFLYISVFLPFCSFTPLLKQILTHNCCTFYHF
jgi:hypothetical protein